MRDLISVDRVALLHPKIRNEVKYLIEKAEAGFPANIAVRVVQGLRTIAYQNELYAQGRRGIPGEKIVTNARGGLSNHNYGLAFDFAILYDVNKDGKFETLSWDTLKDYDRDGQKDWQEVVKIFKAAGYTWGGDFASIPDAPHLQKMFGYSINQLLAKYKTRIVDAKGYVFI